MKVVVFGAAGWTGRAILENLSGRHEIRAADYNPESWNEWSDVDGTWDGGEKIHGDIADYATVDRAVAGMDAVIHAAVLFSAAPGAYTVDDERPYLFNLKGLWNVLEASREHGIKRVVHLGSCPTVHPKGIFFSSEVRRPDGHPYAISKRLQEEMCRQYHEAHGLSIIVLRPDYIIDSRLGLGRMKEKLGPEGARRANGWVCRHDVAEACRLAMESDSIDFDIFHVVGTPEADANCNVARSREVLGLEYKGDLDQYR